MSGDGTISKLYILLGLKSTLDEDGKKAAASASKTALAVGATMTAIGVSAKLMADNVNQAYLSFDTAIAQVKSLGGVTAEEMDLIRESAISLSKEMPISASEVAAGYYAMRSAGYSAANAIAEIPAIARAAVAGNMDLATAVNAVTMVLDIYGARAGDATDITNTLLGTVQLFKTTLPELQQQLSKSADAANTLGMDFDELNAASGLLRKNFLSAEEAGTGLKTFLLKLADANTQAYLESLGVSISDTSGNFVGLQSVLDQLDTALQESGGNINQMAVLNKAFGAEGVRVAMSLINQKDALGEYTAALKEGRAVDQAFEAQMESTGAQLEIARNQMDAVKIALGDAMAPATLAAAGAMGGLATVLESVPAPLQAIAGTGLIAGQSLVAIGPAIAGVAPILTLYRESTFAATVATQGFTAALLANPAALAAVAIAGLALTLGTYYLATKQAENATKDLNVASRSAIDIKREAIKQTQIEIEHQQTRLRYLQEQEAEYRRLGGALNEFSASLVASDVAGKTQEIADLNEELATLEDEIATLEQSEVDLDLAESQQDVDDLESSLSRILGLMDELSGASRSKAELEDTEAIQEIRVRTSQKDLDEAKAALVAWEAGEDNAYAMEFGATAARERHQELIDDVTEAQVALNRATREHEDTLAEISEFDDKYAEKQSDLITTIANLNQKYEDLDLTLQDVAEGQDAVNQKVREFIALTPAGQETLRQIDLLLGIGPPAEPASGESTEHTPISFYGRGYTTPTLGAASPPIEDEEKLQKLREIRNQLDSDNKLTNEDLQEIYQELTETDIPNLGAQHDVTVSGMIAAIDTYIMRQETAIENMRALGGTPGPTLSVPSNQPQASAAIGLSRVPRDMNIRVHRGEAIVPASETRNQTIVINNPVVRQDSDIDRLTNQIFRRLQRA